LAREIVEQSRTIPFPQLTQTGLVPRLQQVPGLQGATQSPWTISRRGVTYTVTAAVCSVDDQRDGRGVHTGGGFCAGQVAGTVSGDATPNDFKRVTVQVSFADGTQTRRVTQTALISTNGAADAAGILSLKATSGGGTPTQPLITTPTTTTPTVTFQAEATSSATRVIWSVDGVDRTPDATSAGGNLWNFTLNLTAPQLPDGTYDIGVRAVDATGVQGTTTTIPLRLVRGPSGPPINVVAGVNTVKTRDTSNALVDREVVEVEWNETKARNVIGYRVYRDGTTLICPRNASTGVADTNLLVTKPGCVDTAPTFGTYSVRSLYLSASNVVTEGGAATTAPVTPPGPNILNLGSGLLASNQLTGCPGSDQRALTASRPAFTNISIAGSPTLRWCATASRWGFSSTATTAWLEVNNSHPSQDCTVTGAMGSNGPANIPGGSTSVNFPKGTNRRAVPLTLPSTLLTTSDRLNILFRFQGQGCDTLNVGGGGDPTSSRLELSGGAVTPNPPTNLQANPDPATGGIRLTWTAPVGGPDAGLLPRLPRRQRRARRAHRPYRRPDHADHHRSRYRARREHAVLGDGGRPGTGPGRDDPQVVVGIDRGRGDPMTDERGFTLVELLVAMSLMVIVLLAVLTSFDSFNDNQRKTNLRADAQESARAAVDSISRDLRDTVSIVDPVTNAAAAVERAGPNDLIIRTFGRNTTNVANREGWVRARYCLTTSTPTSARLIRQQKNFTGAPTPVPSGTACPGPVGTAATDDWTTSVVVAQNVTNLRPGPRPQLSVFDFGYNENGPSPANIVSVTSRLFVDINGPNAVPGEVPLQSAVNLRNANRPPVAAFSITVQGRSLVLNASSSFDPEQQPLSYEWWVDGVKLASTDARTQTGVLGLGGHTVRLVVATRPTSPSRTSNR
jgi:prepilin-type N-terminal cleavage/methylation domain-containing protein